MPWAPASGYLSMPSHELGKTVIVALMYVMCGTEQPLLKTSPSTQSLRPYSYYIVMQMGL